ASRARPLAAYAVAGLLAVTSAACQPKAGTTGPPKASGKGGAPLTMAAPSTPQTPDPAQTGQNKSYLEGAAGEPPIVRRSDGTLQPGLATSWRYTSTDNTTMELRLRPGVKFADGSPLTAQAVVDHFAYVLKSGGQFVPLFAGDKFTATGPL